ncbi:CoA pyrophosphatase [Alteromonas pelagimontana]|uniref:CoA pyrophosphatase n=1 Tax=Alteromonas pelagimontana TaxID=1858656 RepID=A0A6M4MHM8_9ALTE|nr:CoA pyrophosphatase [Alteromonas pelagimontana]QJR82583.1 CoA pyrophosphatase [Alteromonas pelagimontana]
MHKAEFIRRFHHIQAVALEPDYPLRSKGRPAAVLIPLVDKPDGLHVLLTERAHHLRHHPGQISFPGGAVDPSDASIFDAAIREAQEEIGLPSQNISIVGALPVYRTISGYTITPVVGFVDPDFETKLDANEVASAFDVPLAFLMDRQNHLAHHTHRHGETFPIYFIPWQDRMIWGATAAMLRNLSFYLAE